MVSITFQWVKSVLNHIHSCLIYNNVIQWNNNIICSLQLREWSILFYTKNLVYFKYVINCCII